MNNTMKKQDLNDLLAFALIALLILLTAIIEAI